MGYLTLTFPLGAREAERVESVCEAAGALSVTFSDALDEPVLEPRPGEVRLWRATDVQALFPDSAQSQQLQVTLARALELGQSEIAISTLDDRIWEREWLKDFHAQRFGERLWICPHHETVPDLQAVVVRLDPGLAFGTGHHPSTALCLEWLDSAVQRGDRVVDYGCGSGILAIAALKLGATSAACFDIDAQALLATAENAQANGIGSELSIFVDADKLQPCDVVIANILSQILIELAPRLASLVVPAGRIVLAGLMTSEAHDVAAAFLPWFDIEPSAPRDGWIRLAGVRRD